MCLGPSKEKDIDIKNLLTKRTEMPNKIVFLKEYDDVFTHFLS
jgi:hypothetical protein